MPTFTTAFPAARSATTVPLGNLPLGPVRAAPDSVEPQASLAGGGGLQHAVRVSVCMLTSGTAVEIDRFFARYPHEAAVDYLHDNADALAAAVAEAGGDSAVSFGLLDGVAIVSDA